MRRRTAMITSTLGQRTSPGTLPAALSSGAWSAAQLSISWGDTRLSPVMRRSRESSRGCWPTRRSGLDIQEWRWNRCGEPQKSRVFRLIGGDIGQLWRTLSGSSSGTIALDLGRNRLALSRQRLQAAGQGLTKPAQINSAVPLGVAAQVSQGARQHPNGSHQIAL